MQLISPSWRARAQVVGLVVFCLPQGTVSAQQNLQLSLGRPEVLAPEHVFASFDAAALSADGALFILDGMELKLLKLSPEGTVIWSVGRRGKGPGEFQSPYRVTGSWDGGALVLDRSLNQIVLFSPSGAYVAAHRLPFAFLQVDGLAQLQDGRIAIAGMTRWGGRAAEHSIHVFSDSLRYLYSFGPLAQAAAVESIGMVGSGGITVDDDGTILLTLKRPYEIYRYEPTGKLLGMLAVPIQFDLGLDDIFQVINHEGRSIRTVTAKAREVLLPLPARWLPSHELYLAGRQKYYHTEFDLIGSNGALLSTVPAPRDVVGLLAVDTRRSLLYCEMLRNEEPVLVKVPYSIHKPRRGQ